MSMIVAIDTSLRKFTLYYIFLRDIFKIWMDNCTVGSANLKVVWKEMCRTNRMI